jgi:hypothetical protein
LSKALIFVNSVLPALPLLTPINPENSIRFVVLTLSL